MNSFLRRWVAALLTLAALVLLFTLGMDPYGIIGTPRIPGLNAEKVAGAEWPRLTKAYLVDKSDAATLLIGASNVDVGMNPEGPAWPADARPVFNLAIDGADPSVQLRYLQHALLTTHPKRVLIGLSFEDALLFPRNPARRLASEVQAQISFERRLRLTPDGAPNPDYTMARIEDLAFATFSTTALKDSALTLLRQNDPLATYQSRLGWNSGGKFLGWAQAEGQSVLFADKDNQKAADLIRWSRTQQYLVRPVADMIRLAQQHGAEVIVFILPTHADELELIRQLGLTDRELAWRNELAATVSAASPGHPVPLWDFSGYSSYTAEPVPAPGDKRTRMRWFWEPIHFRPVLGDLMVRRMLATDGPPDFGTPITITGTAAEDKRFVDAQTEWVRSHPADVARIQAIVAATIKARCGPANPPCPTLTPGPTARR